MCGACGHAVVVDPVFPSGRTLRGTLIAAQVITRLAGSSPGLSVIGVTDGFVVRVPGRQQQVCTTVADAWLALDHFVAHDPRLSAGSAECEAHYVAAGHGALFDAVLNASAVLRAAEGSGGQRFGPGHRLSPGSA